MYQQGSARVLTFEPHATAPPQSEINVDDPEQMVSDLQRALVTATAVHRAPQRVLCLGVGGGTIPRALRKMLPTATVDAVDIDEEVIRVAREWFGLTSDNGLRLHVADARGFVRRACAEGRRWDVVILDVFDRHYTPTHLMTVEFFRELGHILDQDGLVAINTFAQGYLRDREAQTYAASFSNFFEVSTGGPNRVIVAYATAMPQDEVIYANLRARAEDLRRIGVCAETAAGHLRQMADWANDASPLTDEERQCPRIARLRQRAVKDSATSVVS